MKAKSTGNGEGNYAMPTPGSQQAILTQVIDLGTQKEDFKGEEKLIHKVRIGFELTDEFYEKGENKEKVPFTVSRDFTFSTSSKAHLRAFIEGAIARKITAEEEEEGFDLFTLLPGKNKSGNFIINLSINKSTKGKDYVFINSISPLMKGQVEKKPKTALVKFDFTSDEPTGRYRDSSHDVTGHIETFEVLPEYVQKKIKASMEYSSVFLKKDTEDGISEEQSDDVPF